MSSNPNSGAEELESAARSIGWASGFRLGLYYALFFTVTFSGVYAAAYFAFVPVIHQREMDIVRSRAAEYRLWYLGGGWEMVVARMEEQSMQSGDMMFVRISAPGGTRVNFIAPGSGQLPVDELKRLGPSATGLGVAAGGDRWAIVSLPAGEPGFVLQAGKNLRASEAILARLRFIGVLTLIVGMIVATLGGALTTYRAMAPIRQLIVAMQSIQRGGELGRRVEPEPGRNELNALVEVYNKLLARNEALIEGMHNALDNVAHDFRTPLSRLRITAERALVDGGNPDEAREALADCVEESEHLGRLLTTLMDVAEAESGAMRLDLEDISLPDLVESIVELYELVAEEKQVAVETDLPEQCIIRADQTRLGQALANLVDNAIKYSPSGGTIRVAVSDASGRARVAVSDEGIGIGAADLPHIWERLFRAEPSRSSPGAGLGLSLVKAIIEAHGGSVSVESAVGRGSTFQLDLPVGKGEVTSSTASTRPRHAHTVGPRSASNPRR